MSHRGVAMRRHEVRSRVGEQVCALRRGRENLTSGESAAPAVAGYVADMTAQLESMATAAHLDLLAYFLAMAHAEAKAASQVDIGAAGGPAPSR